MRQLSVLEKATDGKLESSAPGFRNETLPALAQGALFGSIAGVLAGVGMLLAQQSRQIPEVLSMPAGSVIVLDHAESGEVYEIDIDLCNVSGRTVRIVGAYDAAHCDENGCRRIPGLPVAVEPGKTVSIATTYQPARLGRVTKPLLLYTDHPDAPEVLLPLVLDVRAANEEP